MSDNCCTLPFAKSINYEESGKIQAEFDKLLYGFWSLRVMVEARWRDDGRVKFAM